MRFVSKSTNQYRQSDEEKKKQNDEIKSKTKQDLQDKASFFAKPAEHLFLNTNTSKDNSDEFMNFLFGLGNASKKASELIKDKNKMIGKYIKTKK